MNDEIEPILVGETDEVETEGNAFGDAVRKAKEAGEDEFTVGGETYKVKESVEEAKVDEAKFNNAAEAERFGDMVKGIIEKQPKRKLQQKKLLKSLKN